MTNSEIRTSATDTLCDAAGLLRIAAGAVRGAIDVSAFNREELKMLRRSAEELERFRESFATLGLAFELRTQSLAEIEPYQPEEDNMPATMKNVRTVLDRSRAAADSNSAQFEVELLRLVDRLARAEISDTELEESPERIAEFLDCQQLSHDDLLRLVDERKQVISAHTHLRSETKLRAAAAAAQTAADEHDIETARVRKARWDEFQALKMQAAVAADGVAALERSRDVMLRLNKLPPATTRRERALSEQTVSIAKRMRALQQMIDGHQTVEVPGLAIPVGQFPGHAVSDLKAKLADSNKRGPEQIAAWKLQLAGAEKVLAKTKSDLAATTEEYNNVNAELREISAMRFELSIPENV